MLTAFFCNIFCRVERASRRCRLLTSDSKDLAVSIKREVNRTTRSRDSHLKFSRSVQRPTMAYFNLDCNMMMMMMKKKKMAADRHLGSGPTRNRSIRSNVPENHTLESNTNSIGATVIVIWNFRDAKFHDVITEWHTLSVRITLTCHIGEHFVKVLAYSNKNCQGRSILKNCGHTHKRTNPQAYM